MKIVLAFLFVAFVAFANGCNLTEEDCPTFSLNERTLADVASTMASATVDFSEQGVTTLAIYPSAFSGYSSCFTLNAEATLNGLEMRVDSRGGPETQPADSQCEDNCCPVFKDCDPVSFELAAGAGIDSFSGRMDFVVTDSSGAREIVVDGPCATSTDGALINADVTECDFESCDANAICR